MAQTNDPDIFALHSDVTQAYPELFVDVDQSVADAVRSIMADSILEGSRPTREAVKRRIQRMTPQEQSHV